MRRSSLFWGVVLLLLGGLMLADAAGVRLPTGARPHDFFWPLLLILLGGWVILGVLRQSRVSTEQGFVDLQGAQQAALRINHGAGELKIADGAGPGQLASGSFAGGLEQSARRQGDRLDVTMSPPQRWVIFPGGERYDWDVRLNRDVPLDLELHTGADRANVDLRALRLTSLRLETGARETRVTLPSAGRLRAEFHLGAASLTVQVPEGVAGRVRVSQGVSDVRVDQRRFPWAGDCYQSADFETAANAVDIKVEAGAAHVEIM